MGVVEKGYGSDSETRREWLWHRRLGPSITSSALLGLGREFGRCSSTQLAQLCLTGIRTAGRRGAASFCRLSVGCIFPRRAACRPWTASPLFFFLIHLARLSVCSSAEFAILFMFSAD